MKKLLVVVSVFVVVIGALLGYLGFFSTYTVVEREMGPYRMVYEDFTGPYEKTGPVMDRIYQSLKDDGIETFKGFGMYYDDPAQVPGEKLRSKVGSIVEEKDWQKLAALKKRYTTIDFPLSRCVVVEFPYRSILSYMIGPMKAYPLLGEFMNTNNYQADYGLEIYDVPGKKIYYAMPVRGN
jgi:hypothetical protein